MEKIILKSVYNYNTYCILKNDKSEWQDFVASKEKLLEYFDDKTGEPLNDDIANLENAVNNWNPSEFEKYWNKLNLTSELEYVISR